MILQQRAETGLPGAWELAATVKAAWRSGQTPVAAADALAAHPELALHRSVVIDLAYEEYLILEQGGAAPDPAKFAEQFPDFQASVQDMLDAHCLLLAKPELLAAPSAGWPEVGSTFEGLELRSELGRGAFGRAYLGYDPTIGRLRALKLAPGGSAEARLIGRLSHPNVIDICWARQVDRRTAVCMPFVGASTLADGIAASAGTWRCSDVLLSATHADASDVPLDSRPAPVVRSADSFLVGACAIGARIAEAVDYLHKQNVIHGDLKPTNVVLEPGGSPRVIDFNLAAGEESPTAFRGTPAYMAPELLDLAMEGGNANGVDGGKADLFALGVLLIEFLTGRHPFRSGTNGTLAAQTAAIHRGPPPLPPSIPRPLARVLASCLAVNPSDRPESAGIVAAALDRFVHRERTKGRRRRRLALVLCSLAVLGALAAAAGAMWPAKPAAVVEGERPPESATDFFNRGLRLLHEGKSSAARADFVAAHERSKDPWALAYAAYCYSLDGQHAVAAKMGTQALAGGASGSEVENNLGYALIQLDMHENAIPHLDAALERAPGLQAALYNRAVARFQMTLTGKPDPRSLEDIKAALVAGPSSAELHLNAARIFTYWSKSDPSLIEAALNELDRAVLTGKSPSAIRKDPLLKPLARNPRFAAIIQQSDHAGKSSPVSLPLVEPCP